jgi:flagellar protein FlgJ
MIDPTNNLSGNFAVDVNGLNSLKSAAKQNSPEALKAAAKQFESLFMNMIMKSMREATPKDGLFDSEQTKMYTSMLDQQLSQNLSNRGVGLADMLIRQLTVRSESIDGQSLLLNKGQADALMKSQSSSDPGTVNPSQPAHIQEFHERMSPHAEEASKATGIPAKFMIGQAALESGWGKHEVRGDNGTASHNLFGIKATADWKGKTVEATTTEFVNGVAETRKEKFRAYDSYADSFKDYANFLSSNPRYERVLANSRDASSFAQGLQRAGYATDPNYAAKLTRIINQSLS